MAYVAFFQKDVTFSLAFNSAVIFDHHASGQYALSSKAAADIATHCPFLLYRIFPTTVLLVFESVFST